MLSISPTDKSPTRVVVIEDERELREGLRGLLDFTPHFKCVAGFAAMGRHF